jgi:hypothetical protein
VSGRGQIFQAPTLERLLRLGDQTGIDLRSMADRLRHSLERRQVSSPTDSVSTRFPLAGRPQAVRGSETDGGSRKSKEVPVVLLTSKNGVGW